MNIDPSSIALAHLGLETAKTMLSTYSNFKKRNAIHLLELLSKCDADFSNVKSRDDFHKYVFRIIEEASSEVENEKIIAWKNAIVSLAVNFDENTLKEEFIKILSNLSVFDLLTLRYIYTNEFDTNSLCEDTVSYFELTGIDSECTWLSIRKLANNFLIDGRGNVILFDGLSPSERIYNKNKIGELFLKFVSEI
ncbi:MAG: hypothetical protein N4A48_02130 [Tepidibacter sp.]|jgi:hypothetical protein|uniref:hypothetical protein n=1 Tax=Tepidibacter sp. TaxID=2529387 RepID=UPI0025E9C4AA|nr:hypothetical protein [Tepidibacter sp.]MCT4507554.1 hypothetical protein [Tepidibacter sp.]